MNDAPPIDSRNGTTPSINTNNNTGNNSNSTNNAPQPQELNNGMETSNHEPPREDHQAGENDNALIGSAHLKPVFMGNLDYNCTVEDLEDLFNRPPRGEPMAIDRVDLKRGYAFIFFQEARSQNTKDRLERYVDEINNMDIPKVSKQLRAEFARGDGRIRRKEEDRRRHISPCETLFVVNFSAETTKREDLEMLFSRYGEIVRIDMKKNYAFVQFTKVEDATEAKDATNGGRLDQSVITVEYVAQRQNGRHHRDRGRDSRDRDYSSRRSPPRGGRYDDYRRRSRSPPRDRYDDYRRGGGRDRSPPRDRYDDYRRGRSRSRSPIVRYRSRSPSPRRDRRSYEDYRRNDRDYRDAGRGRSNEREYRDVRGYK